MYCENPSQNHALGYILLSNHSDESPKNPPCDQPTRAQAKSVKVLRPSSARLSHLYPPCIFLELLARTRLCKCIVKTLPAILISLGYKDKGP